MKLGVKKDGGDVDALTAATISSRAYVDAVSRAYKAYCEKAGVEACREHRFGCFEYSKCGCGRYFGRFGYPRCGSGWCVRCFEQSRNGNGSRDGRDGCSAECRGRDASLRVKSGIESGDWSVKAVPTASSEEVRP